MRMHVFLAIVLSLAVCSESADARRHRHHRHHGHRHETLVDRPTSNTDPLTSNAAANNAIGRLIPRDWRLEPPDPNLQGKRFTSPTGDASLTFFARSAEDVPQDQYLRQFGFAEGEKVTYLRGERNWLVVSGLRGDRIFYRKAILACGGTQWRHVDFEYPAEAKREFDRFVTRMSRALDQARDDCPAADSG